VGEGREEGKTGFEIGGGPGKGGYLRKRVQRLLNVTECGRCRLRLGRRTYIGKEKSCIKRGQKARAGSRCYTCRKNPGHEEGGGGGGQPKKFARWGRIRRERTAITLLLSPKQGGRKGVGG